MMTSGDACSLTMNSSSAVSKRSRNGWSVFVHVANRLLDASTIRFCDLVIHGARHPPRRLLVHAVADQVLVLAIPLGRRMTRSSSAW
jgi:hypothetical protein